VMEQTSSSLRTIAFSTLALLPTEPTALAAGLWMPPIAGPEASAYGSVRFNTSAKMLDTLSEISSLRESSCRRSDHAITPQLDSLFGQTRFLETRIAGGQVAICVDDAPPRQGVSRVGQYSAGSPRRIGPTRSSRHVAKADYLADTKTLNDRNDLLL
jgi:hypothetical protein